MFDTIRKRLAPLARLMLALVLLQSLFVVHEAVAFDIDDSHHVEAIADEPAHVDHGDEASGSCDNCCHCQGHGSHLAILVESLLLMPVSSSSAHRASSAGFISSRITSIDRPPIV